MDVLSPPRSRSPAKVGRVAPGVSLVKGRSTRGGWPRSVAQLSALDPRGPTASRPNRSATIRRTSESHASLTSGVLVTTTPNIRRSNVFTPQRSKMQRFPCRVRHRVVEAARVRMGKYQRDPHSLGSMAWAFRISDAARLMSGSQPTCQFSRPCGRAKPRPNGSDQLVVSRLRTIT
jgi:hypothetical protein